MREFLLMVKEKGNYPKKNDESTEVYSILSEAKTRQFIKETINNNYELDIFGYDYLEKEGHNNNNNNNQNKPIYNHTIVQGDYIRDSVLRDFKPTINPTNTDDKERATRLPIVKFWEYLSNNKLLSTIIGGIIVAIIISILKAYKMI